MKKLSIIWIMIIIIIGCNKQKDNHVIQSPNGDIKVSFSLKNEDQFSYNIIRKGKIIIEDSYVSFDFKNMMSIDGRLKLLNVEQSSFNENWEMPWGEQLIVNNSYNESKIFLQEYNDDRRKFNIIFRVFDDGVGFRFEFPKQEGFDNVLITDENTEFHFTGDHKTWWLPGDWDTYEHLYNETLFSEINALEKQNHPNLKASYIPENAVSTPVTLKTEDDIYLSIHEADLTDYPEMTLKVDKEKMLFVSELVGSEILKAKAEINTPFISPWRTIQIADKPGDLIESKLILNLNEPNSIGETNYFTPMKYVGIWWEMHIGKSTWDYSGTQDMNTFIQGNSGKSRHGATTENAKKYIDFASKNRIKGLLIEGWNTGWEQWINTENREGVFDFMTPYPDYNYDEVLNYAKNNNVELIMHHETSSAPLTYEKQMDEAYDFMKKNDINSVKTGYVGKIIPKGEYHHGQWMVKHYQKVLDKTADKKIVVNAHEPIKATGKRRTYPNAISREGIRGQEFNAWATDGGNPPEHIPIVAFTRMLAGPIDFTPGVFNLKFDEYKSDNQVNTTLAKQLALYVILYSPIQMACDLPEHYMKNGKTHPMFQFIKDVGVNWEESKVLDAEIGDYVVIARKERESENWFVGGASDENARKVKIDFNFLDPNFQYVATIYKDGDKAHWNSNPSEYLIDKTEINSDSEIEINMAEGGGFAISLLKK